MRLAAAAAAVALLIGACGTGLPRGPDVTLVVQRAGAPVERAPIAGALTFRPGGNELVAAGP
jgi:hypothetical protein